MRFLILLPVISLAIAATGTHAGAQNYPWCAHYGKGGGDLNCGFSTWDQCLADVSGIGGFCERNNTYSPAVSPGPRRRVRHRAQRNS
jgi:hypothetical protein